MDPFLEREKELLRLNATLDSKCDSLDADESHSKLQSAGTKTKSNKGRNGKGVRGNGPAKGKLAKGANGTQSIKLKMSYEKVDVKSYYEELSKSIWRLDLMNANENETNGTEVLAAVCSMTTDVVGGDALIEQDVDKWKKIATDKIESTAQSIEGSTGSNGDVIGVKEMAAPKTLSNANPIEKFLNDFTVDPNKLNIDPSNTAMGDFSRGGGGSRTAANGYSHGSGETSPAECSLNGRMLVTPANIVPRHFLKKNVSMDGMLKFLKAKVTILQQELDLSHKENLKYTENLSKSVEAQKKLEYQRDQANHKNDTLKAQIKKVEEQNIELEAKLKEKTAIQTSFRRELDDVKIKLKQSTQSSSALENRLFKSQEDLEYLRKNYHTAKGAEKELQATLQQERKFFENQLKMLQKQRTDLIAAYKKQLLLLDNLKRQNTCLEHAKLLQIGEKEFSKILDWNPDVNK